MAIVHFLSAHFDIHTLELSSIGNAVIHNNAIDLAPITATVQVIVVIAEFSLCHGIFHRNFSKRSAVRHCDIID